MHSRLRSLVVLLACAAVTATAVVLGAPAQAAPDLTALAQASRPQWNLARTNSRDSCWPEYALDAAGNQKAAAARKGFPTTGQGGCVSAGSAFATYWTAKQCSATEVRVVYSLYFPKDGFSGSLLGNDLGHAYDWEHVTVFWKQQADGSWARDHLLLGRHGNEILQAWSSAETWDAARATAGTAQAYPRIYVGWAKHAMFNHTGGLSDLASQYTNNEFRNTAYPVRWTDELVEVPDGGALAQRFDAFSWGSASSTPAVMARSLCSLVANG